MNDDQVLVIADADGNYYMLSALVRKQTQVLDSKKADLISAVQAPVRTVGYLNLEVAKLGGFGVATIQSPMPG